MLFSAGFDNYRCSQCSAEWSNVVPTSIIPMSGTCALAGTFWAELFGNYFAPSWWFKLCGFVVAACTLWMYYELLDRTSNRWIRRKTCPRCKGALTHLGSGFYDGIVPNPWELILYAITIGTSVVVWQVTASR